MKSKIVKCVGCGKEYPRKELNRNFRCHDCGYPFMIKTLTQIHDKSGPEYEKWRHAVRASADKL